MKLLYITSLSGKRINGFMRSAIIASQELGIDFHMACNMDMADKEGYKQDCKDYGITVYHIPFERNPLSVKNLKAFRALDSLIREEHFDIIHCNTPIGGLLGRLAGKKTGAKVIYQAHGFHFWQGAPVKNWILYYPIEKHLSRYTDILITIAEDDYELAKRMHVKKVEYVHGVGIDLKRFVKRNNSDRNVILRNELGIPESARVLLSVGELNSNKNHDVVIKSLSKIEDDNLYFVICGSGENNTHLEKLIEENNLNRNVILAGFRTDIPEFYRMADLFVFPSLREGIPGAVMEAIATGVPVIASDIRGVRDIVPDKAYRFDPEDATGLAELIVNVLDRDNTENTNKNLENLKPYEFDHVVAELKDIYDASCK